MSRVDKGPGDGLAGLVAGIRARTRRSALFAASLWTGVLVATGLAVAWLLATPEGWRGGSPIPLVVDLAVLLVAAAGFVILWRLLLKWLDDSRIAREMDEAGDLGRGSVLGALELSRDPPAGVSVSLSRRAEDRVLAALPREPESLAGSLGAVARTWGRRGGIVLMAAVGVLGILALASPRRALSAWGGLLRPGEILTTAALPLTVLEPGSDSLPRGSEVRVVVEAPGRDRVRAEWQFDGDVARSRDVTVEDGTATASLGALEAPVEFRMVAPDGATTSLRRVIPLDPLLLTDLRVELLFPPHTGIGPRQLGREIPPLEVPAGTRIRFQGRASRGLEAVSLRRVGEVDLGDGDTAGAEMPDQAPLGEAGTGEREDGGAPGVELSVDDRRFSGEWQPSLSGTYAWSLEAGGEEEAGAAPPPLRLTVVADSAPTVELLFPGRDTVLPLDRRQPLVIQGRDDYGIARMDLVARRIGVGGEAEEPVVQPLRAGGMRGAMARPLLDLSTWDLVPGDTVRYRVRVVDNAPRPQTAETREYALRVPRRSESARAVQEELDQVTEMLDSLRAEAGRTARETRDLERRGVQQERQAADAGREAGQTGSQSSRSSREEASFQAREDARRAARQQEGLLSQADSVRSEIERLRQALEEGVLAEPELRRDLEELESLMERVAPDSLRAETERMSEEVGEMNAEELQEALEQMAESQEELRQRIEESLDRVRRTAAEQDFRASAQEARDLAREQEALSEALDAGDESSRRTEQQEELAERSRRLQEDVQGLEERLGRMEEEGARQGARRAGEMAESATQAMERTSQMLSRPQSGQSGEASDSARSAYQNLEQAADALDQARQEMTQSRENARQQAYRQTASEALALARRQSEIQERMGSRDAEERSRAQGDQAAVMEGLRNLESNLQESGAQQSESDEGVGEALEQARQSVQQVLRSMQDPSGDTPSPSAASNEAVEALNELARSASESSQRQQGGGQQSQQSSGGQTGQQLQEMAQRQAGISDQSGALQSMQLGQAVQERRLRQIASEQGRLGRDLGQLAVQPGSDGEVLGDLRELAREARELAREMEGGRLDAETVRRQERLFHRLLDAGRSLEKDETSSERESRTAETTPGLEVESLTIEDVGGQRFPLPDSEVLRSLSPAQRALVIRYFERLNGTEAPGSIQEPGSVQAPGSIEGVDRIPEGDGR